MNLHPNPSPLPRPVATPTGGPSADVAACLAEVQALARALAEELLVHVRLGPGLPRAACDPADLKSALLHLVFNARDAMAGRGLVSIRAMRALHGDVPAVELRIADTGIGMAPHTLARALDPCFTTKCEGLGGAGLPMVEQFVRDAGGALAIESTPGLGTRVTLRLPATAVESEPISRE
ncbi:MAG TPA: ATP-binding protein [Allosphingosinicella sp.]|nr:ATP-binding protein [Allosphingosinicella sp.]